MFAATQGTEPKLFHCSWTMSSQCRNPTKNYPCCVGENKLFELRISISQFEVRAFRLTRVVFWRNLSLGFHHFFQFFHFFQEVKNRWSIWWQWSKESIDHAMDTHIVFLQPLKLQGCNRFCKNRSDQSYQPKMSQHDATPENAGWHSLSSWLTFPFQLQLRHLHRQNRVPNPFITPVQQKEHGECFHSNTISEQIPFIPFFSMAIHKDNIYCILLYIGERERNERKKSSLNSLFSYLYDVYMKTCICLFSRIKGRESWIITYRCWDWAYCWKPVNSKLKSDGTHSPSKPSQFSFWW